MDETLIIYECKNPNAATDQTSGLVCARTFAKKSVRRTGKNATNNAKFRKQYDTWHAHVIMA